MRATCLKVIVFRLLRVCTRLQVLGRAGTTATQFAAGLSSVARGSWPAHAYTSLQHLSLGEGEPAARASFRAARMASGPHSCQGLPRGAIARRSRPSRVVRCLRASLDNFDTPAQYNKAAPAVAYKCCKRRKEGPGDKSATSVGEAAPPRPPLPPPGRQPRCCVLPVHLDTQDLKSSRWSKASPVSRWSRASPVRQEDAVIAAISAHHLQRVGTEGDPVYGCSSVQCAAALQNRIGYDKRTYSAK